MLSADGVELADFYGACFPLKNGVLGYDILERRVLIFNGDGVLTAVHKGFDFPDFHQLYEMNLSDTDDPLIPVYQNRRSEFINTKGDVVISCQYRYTSGFSQGFAIERAMTIMSLAHG